MAYGKLRLDHKGMAAMIASAEVSAAVNALGDSVASAANGETVSGDPVPIGVRSRNAEGGRLSARTAVDVFMRHPAGLRIEAKRGTLARAAGSVGLEVTRKR